MQCDIKKTEHYCTRYFSDLRVTLGFKQNVKKASENKLNSILCTFDSVVKLAKSSTLRHSKDDFTHCIFIRTVDLETKFSQKTKNKKIYLKLDIKILVSNISESPA